MPKVLLCYVSTNAKVSVLRQYASALLLFLLCASLSTRAEYTIPAGRSITWYPAGLDVVGGIPTSFARTNAVTGLHPDGSVNDATMINNAISAAASNTVLTIPAGTYKITSDILMRNGVVLRGAQAAMAPWMPAPNASATTLMMNNGCRIRFSGGSKDSSWYPGVQSGISITSGYTQGSTSLTLSSSSGLAVGNYIAVYQNKDSAWIDDRGYNWLGEDSGSDPHVWAQYTQITGINGNTITISPALYQVTPNPTGQSVRKQTFGISMAGLENMRIYGDGGSSKGIISASFSKFCWVKGVETYNAGSSSSGSPHIWTEFCYANEYRHNYHHYGASHDSGANYGIEFYHWNSRHKVEDNIVRETRHSIVFEGGGSGCVILYNYTDDNWESVQGQITTRDNSFLSEDEVGNHGSHPYMNLWEGNHGSCFWADYTQGSSSHGTLFRNSWSGSQSSYSLSNPWLWTIVEIEAYNRYYNIIGNIIGNSSMSSGTVINDGGGGSRPQMFRFGYTGAGGSHTDSQSYSTAILHGNYDFVSDSVHDWASTDHALPASLYYAAKPSWFGDRTWPPFDYSRIAAAQIARTNIPAGYRYVFGIDPPSSGNQAPHAVATATTSTSGVAPLTVAFSSNGSSDPEGATLSYSWDFGDGTTSTAANPSHTYVSAGSFVVRLTVSDGINSSLSGNINITATAPEPKPMPPTDLQVLAGGG